MADILEEEGSPPSPKLILEDDEVSGGGTGGAVSEKKSRKRAKGKRGKASKVSQAYAAAVQKSKEGTRSPRMSARKKRKGSQHSVRSLAHAFNSGATPDGSKGSSTATIDIPSESGSSGTRSGRSSKASSPTKRRRSSLITKPTLDNCRRFIFGEGSSERIEVWVREVFDSSSSSDVFSDEMGASSSSSSSSLMSESGVTTSMIGGRTSMSSLSGLSTPGATGVGAGGRASSPAVNAAAALLVPDQLHVTGLFVWPSAILLSEYLFYNPDLVTGKSVMELGCGVGLPSLTAAKLGATQVWMTDASIQRRVRENAEWNCQANDCEDTCQVVPLTWARFSSETVKLSPDLIIGSDIFFAETDFEDIICTAQHYFDRGCKAFVVCIDRRGTAHTLSALLMRWHMHCEIIEGTDALKRGSNYLSLEDSEKLMLCRISAAKAGGTTHRQHSSLNSLKTVLGLLALPRYDTA